MTLPEANAAITVHNGGSVGTSLLKEKAAQQRWKKIEDILYQVCDRLHVAPARLREIPIARVVQAAKDVGETNVVEAVVKASIARFAAEHADPEASSLKSR